MNLERSAEHLLGELLIYRRGERGVGAALQKKSQPPMIL
jgi:hypothetical protein